MSLAGTAPAFGFEKVLPSVRPLAVKHGVSRPAARGAGRLNTVGDLVVFSMAEFQG